MHRRWIPALLLSLAPALSWSAPICPQAHRIENQWRMVTNTWIRNINELWLYLVDVGYKAAQDDEKGFIVFTHPQRPGSTIVMSNAGMIDRRLTLSKEEISRAIWAVLNRISYISPDVQ